MIKFSFIKRGQSDDIREPPFIPRAFHRHFHFFVIFIESRSLRAFSLPSPSCGSHLIDSTENDQSRPYISLSYRPFASRARRIASRYPALSRILFTLQRVPSVLQRVTGKCVFIYIHSAPAFPESI
jgi:hypothetical protein